MVAGEALRNDLVQDYDQRQSDVTTDLPRTLGVGYFDTCSHGTLGKVVNHHQKHAFLSIIKPTGDYSEQATRCPISSRTHSESVPAHTQRSAVGDIDTQGGPTS